MRSIFRLVGILLVLGLIYFLSIGPAVALEEKKTLSKSTFDLVYSPLEKAAHKIPEAEGLLKNYVQWWKHAVQK